jgi:hypothetical protein
MAFGREPMVFRKGGTSLLARLHGTSHQSADPDAAVWPPLREHETSVVLTEEGPAQSASFEEVMSNQHIFMILHKRDPATSPARSLKRVRET